MYWKGTNPILIHPILKTLWIYTSMKSTKLKIPHPVFMANAGKNPWLPPCWIYFWLVWNQCYQLNYLFLKKIPFLGTETTSSSLLWAILFLLHYPEVQRKVQLEIDEVVGPNRRVTLQDKASLPYTNAVLTESLRMATIVPYALPHSATNDITLNGYKIPKVNT